MCRYLIRPCASPPIMMRRRPHHSLCYHSEARIKRVGGRRSDGEGCGVGKVIRGEGGAFRRDAQDPVHGSEVFREGGVDGAGMEGELAEALDGEGWAVERES